MDYLISSGDTLGGIARANKLGVQDILKLNPQITDPNRIMAGQSIKLPGASTSITTPQPTTGAVSNVPSFQASGATVTSNTIGSPITRNDLQSRRAELEKIATQRSQAEQEQQALFETLSNLQRQSEREQQLSQNIAQSGAQETKLLRDLTLEQRQIGRNQQGRLASGVNIASQQAESRTGVAREDLLYKRLIDSAELQALTGVRQADIQALNTSIGGKEKFIDRALGIEKDLIGRGDTEQKQTRQTLLDIIDFSQGSTFNELTPEEQTAIANTAQLVGVPLSSVQQAMERNKIAFNNEQAKVTADIKKTETSNNPKGDGIFGILDFRTANTVVAQADKFLASDIVKRFNNIQDSKNSIDGISSDTRNPADHQAIVYYFAKALDPESVVREGEYETIKKYAQNVFGRYKGELENAINGTGFLSQEAIQNIKGTVDNRYTSNLKQYSNKKNEAARTINNIAGQDVAGLVLQDMAGVSNTQTPQAPANVISTGKVGNITYTVKKK